MGRPKKIKTEQLAYHATVKVLGKLYMAEGSTALEAIANLKPLGAKGASLLTVTHGDAKREKIFSHPMTFKLFSASRMMREVALKNIKILFDNL